MQAQITVTLLRAFWFSDEGVADENSGASTTMWSFLGMKQVAHIVLLIADANQSPDTENRLLQPKSCYFPVEVVLITSPE